MKSTNSAALGMVFALSVLSCAANALEIDLSTIPLEEEPDSISFDANGTGVTARGYHVEYDPANGSTVIYGPLSTAATLINCCSLFPNFGRPVFTSGELLGNGLSMTLDQDLGQTERDFFSAGFSPGFDNSTDTVDLSTGIRALPSMQLVLFRFDNPVDISRITIQGASNFGRSIWVAGGSDAPDLSAGLVAALNGYTIVNIADPAGSGFITYDLASMTGIEYLMVGTPPRSDLIGDLGPLNGTGGVSFFVDALDVTAAPVLTPGCDIDLNQAAYIDGDTVTANVFRYANPSADPVAIEFKTWLILPELAPLSVINTGADGSFVIPAGTDIDLGPVPLIPVNAAWPRGDYEFSCRMLDPVTGELIAEDRNIFEIQ